MWKQRLMRIGIVTVWLTGLLPFNPAVPPAAASPQEPGPRGQQPDTIPGQYIVVIENGIEPSAVAADHGLPPIHVYRAALNGFAAAVPPQKEARLRADARVNSLVPDRVVHAFDQLPTGIDRIDSEGSAPPAGGDYSGVHVAILDTGIDLDHPDLNVSGSSKNCSSSGLDDGNGHGSHVAGTVGAKGGNGIGVRGVAPGATLHAVKVLNNSGSGSWSGIICGIDWVTDVRTKFNNNQEGGINITAANMSLGGSGSDSANCGDPNNDGKVDDALHSSLCKSARAGVVYLVAAGNSDADAAGSVPAAYDEVLTIAAITDYDGKGGGLASPTCSDRGPDDSFTTFSNWGSDVDLSAPGVCIRSTYKKGGYATLSGTSMATPHVAGAVAKLVGDGIFSPAASADPMKPRNDAMAALGKKPQADSACGYQPRAGKTGGPALYVGQPNENCGANAASSANAVSASTSEETPVTVALNGSDQESCELTFSIASSPSNGSLSAITNDACSGSGPHTDTARVTYTPNANFNGTDSFTYKVNDGSSDSPAATVMVTVAGVNDAPSASNGSAGTTKDVSVVVSLSGADVDGCAGQSFTFTVTGGPSNGVLSAAGGPMTCSGGALSASVTYTPNAGFTGSDSFTFTISDGTAVSNTAAVALTVSAAPAASNASAGTAEDTAVTVTLSGSDLETCELTFVIVTGPSNGTLGGLTNNACSGTGPYTDTAGISYTPIANFNGSDTFTYKVSDGSLESAAATVTITVTAVNDRPAATDRDVSTQQDTQVAITLAGSDPDGCAGQTFVFSATAPANGTLSPATGPMACSGGTLSASMTYMPNPVFTGNDFFTYTISDGGATSNEATVSITVLSPVVFSETFESDPAAAGWTWSGLWHWANNTPCVSPGYKSATRGFYYGSESSCTYDTGARNSGTLTSRTISGVNAGTSAATLSFWYWRQVESYNGAYDKTSVQVSYDNGATWTTVWSKDSRNASESSWTQASIGLSPPANAQLRLRFVFDTMDSVANKYKGWLIDDVQVENGTGGAAGTGASPAQPPGVGGHDEGRAPPREPGGAPGSP